MGKAETVEATETLGEICNKELKADTFLSTRMFQGRERTALVSVIIREYKQQRTQRQGKRHLKRDIWEMVTTLRLSLLPRILYC